MKLYKIYESVLTEGQIEACVSQFGKELFAPEFGGTEPNTDKEDKYIELIDKLSGTGYKTNVNTEFIDMARNLRRCVGANPEILQPEGSVYRGTKSTIGDLLKSFDNIKNPIRMGQLFPMVYGANSPIQSWSDDEDMANDDFGQSGTILLSLLDKFDVARKNGTIEDFISHIIQSELDIKVPIILKYRNTQDDFIFKGSYFNYLSRNDDNEVLRVDNRPIEVMAKIYPIAFSARLFDLLDSINNRS
jgi:hypothetical protein